MEERTIKMKIGFYSKWELELGKKFFIGDHLFAKSMCNSLKKIKGVKSAKLYAKDKEPLEKLDFMIHLNDIRPNKKFADKNLMYFQGSYDIGSEKVYRRQKKFDFDAFLFVSPILHKYHNKISHKSSIYLPFAVDTDFFYPQKKDPNFDFDVAYVGNDIKGEDRTNRYVFPAVNFNFGLFGGTWIPSKKQKLKRLLKFWKPIPQYRKVFEKISQGKISPENLRTLYSSSKINLNCTSKDSADLDIIAFRIYEILACKGFVITDRVPIAEKELKNCVVFTEGADDLINKIKYYLRNPKKREIISKNGLKYIQEKGSMDKRMKDLYKFLKKLK